MSSRASIAILVFATIIASVFAQTATLGYTPGIILWENPNFEGQNGETGGTTGCFGIKHSIAFRSYKITPSTTVRFYSDLDCRGQLVGESSSDKADVTFMSPPLSIRLDHSNAPAPQPKSLKAVAILSGNSTVKGSVTFTQVTVDEPTSIAVNLTGLKPGLHGFHIHVYGDLSNGCASFGLHWNPFNVTHGDIKDDSRHEGDLGNLLAEADGTIKTTFTDTHVKLFGHLSVVGRGIIIHADQDDLGRGNFTDSKTVGHSGARLACGIIGLAAP
ncbi:hypothetical protein M427DRAFT_64017 [Gonapodya prolifera JEL478]|uniref:Superoxide dismutase [Cu-Zn] n=1 Tax=Gonapodya prolifera (strain JEL478) TaxID=1344416 RepID=A0A138ZYB6_GONPJ|nr:hypothetical protein M427DRAFT_64017 [Gonapodya prolifera JEL478]|eukprot:KXS09502.1 hypothetical protein M427DRAFT_64017 [Gonapodya prolifera JEL478]